MPGARRVGDENLLIYRHTLTARRDRAVGLHDSTGHRIAFRYQRPPFPELLHVFETDAARRRLPGPSDSHPRQAANLRVARLSALRLAEVREVWPREIGRAAGRGTRTVVRFGSGGRRNITKKKEKIE